MEIALAVILFIVGLVLIIKGGDFFVDAASWFAEISGIPKLIVGATVVSLATTLPELLVSTMAAAEGKVDMAVGNAVGSVTANIGLIMAIALIFLPSAIHRRDYWPKTALMLTAAGVIVLGGFLGELKIWLAVCLLVIFALFLFENVTAAKRSMREGGDDREARPKATRETVITNVVKFVLGTAGIVIGAQLLVDNGSTLARAIGISERIIGVTVVAIGTSLPELITTITAVAKKQASLSAGNILGANIIDLTLILPLSSLISGKALPFASDAAVLDLAACLLVGIIAMVPALISKKFRRWQGYTLLAVYIGYVYLTCFVL